MVSTYSTANVPSNLRARFVQSIADDCYGSFFHWEPSSAAFSLNMAVRHFGDIMIARHQSADFTQVNRGQTARWLKRRYVVHAAVNCTQTVVFDGKPLVLEGGDFTLLDTSRRCVREQVGPSETIAFAIPEEPLRRHVPNLDDVVGQLFSSNKDSLSSAAAAILRSASELDDAYTSEGVGKRMTKTLLDLLSILAESRIGPSKAGSKQRAVRAAAARRYVDDHLAEPDLSVATVAQALDVSTRYLHMIFASEDESLLDYIRSARLAACSSQLLSPASRHRSISEIAYSCGFNDLSHFCRLFRNTYGMSARDYRKAMKPL